MSDSIKLEALIEVKDLKEIHYKSKRDGSARSLFIQHIYINGPDGGAIKVYLPADKVGSKIIGFNLGVYERDGTLKLIPIFE